MALKGISVGNTALTVNATNAVFDSGSHFIIASDADARIINGVRETNCSHHSMSCRYPWPYCVPSISPDAPEVNNIRIYYVVSCKVEQCVWLGVRWVVVVLLSDGAYILAEILDFC